MFIITNINGSAQTQTVVGKWKNNTGAPVIISKLFASGAPNISGVTWCPNIAISKNEQIIEQAQGAEPSFEVLKKTYIPTVRNENETCLVADAKDMGELKIMPNEIVYVFLMRQSDVESCFLDLVFETV